MNVVIPMAGRGSRFVKAGYRMPKPLIDVQGKPMIQVVVENLGLPGAHVFLALGEHCVEFGLGEVLPRVVAPRACRVVPIEQVTEGAACTVLLAKDLIDNDDELVIANSDQWVDWNPEHFLGFLRGREADGGILTFLSTHPKCSFAAVDEVSCRVTEVAEKRPISNIATVGIYYWRRGRDFVAAAEGMIAANERVNGEFYVAPTYNRMIAAGKTVLNYPVAENKGLGTPEDLERFLAEREMRAKRRAS